MTVLSAGVAFALSVSAPPAELAQSREALEAEMIEAARSLQSQLPIRADSITMTTGVRAEGTEFVYDMSVSQEIPTGQLASVTAAIQSSNQTNLCGNPQAALFIRRGGSMRHIYTDTAGNRLETRVNACP